MMLPTDSLRHSDGSSDQNSSSIPASLGHCGQSSLLYILPECPRFELRKLRLHPKIRRIYCKRRPDVINIVGESIAVIVAKLILGVSPRTFRLEYI